MKDQYDRYETGEENLSLWSHQVQTWYRCQRGWFLTTINNHIGAKWFSVNQRDGEAGPDWDYWDGETFPWDLISERNFDMTGEFDLDDIELAEIFMEELS